jgi:hypothetical protein
MLTNRRSKVEKSTADFYAQLTQPLHELTQSQDQARSRLFPRAKLALDHR